MQRKQKIKSRTVGVKTRRGYEGICNVVVQCQSLTRWNRFIFQYNGSAGSENLGAEPYFVRIKSYTDRGIGSWTHRRSSLQHRRSSVHGRRRCPHHSPTPTCPSLAAPAPTSWPPPPLPSALASRRLAGRLPSLAWREGRSRFFLMFFCRRGQRSMAANGRRGMKLGSAGPLPSPSAAIGWLGAE